MSGNPPFEPAAYPHLFGVAFAVCRDVRNARRVAALVVVLDDVVEALPVGDRRLGLLDPVTELGQEVGGGQHRLARLVVVPSAVFVAGRDARPVEKRPAKTSKPPKLASALTSLGAGDGSPADPVSDVLSELGNHHQLLDSILRPIYSGESTSLLAAERRVLVVSIPSAYRIDSAWRERVREIYPALVEADSKEPKVSRKPRIV